MWRHVLFDLVASGEYATQGDLVAELAVRGHDVDQSSVSRALKARGVQKVDGRYVAPVQRGLPSAVPVLEARLGAGGPLVVLRTIDAAGPMLARALDDAALPGVLGVLSSGDTVFVATSTFDAVDALERFLGRPLRG